MLIKTCKSDECAKVAQAHAAFKVYTLKDMAEIFHVTSRTIYNWMGDNRFSFVKIGSKTYVTERQLQDFLNNHLVESYNLERRVK